MGQLQGLSGQFQGLSGQLQGLSGQFQGLSGQFQGLSGQFQGLQGQSQGLLGQATDIQRSLDCLLNRTSLAVTLSREANLRAMDDAHALTPVPNPDTGAPPPPGFPATRGGERSAAAAHCCFSQRRASWQRVRLPSASSLPRPTALAAIQS